MYWYIKNDQNQVAREYGQLQMVYKSLEKSQTSGGPARLCQQLNSSLQEKDAN